MSWSSSQQRGGRRDGAGRTAVGAGSAAGALRGLCLVLFGTRVPIWPYF